MMMKTDDVLPEEDEFTNEVGTMVATRRRAAALYVDRLTQSWVVRDPDGEFWLLPSDDDCWANREPFELTDQSDLEIVPGHYLHMLNLPF